MTLRGAALLAAMLASGATSLQAAARPRPAPVLGQLVPLDGTVEVASGAGWERVDEQRPLRVGDRVRTGSDGTVRIEFPWMSMVAAPDSIVWVPRNQVLGAVLEEGRTEQASVKDAFVKLATPEARIRGVGRVVARRQEGRTLVMVWEGEARIEGGKGSVTLAGGQGSVVAANGTPAAAAALPRAAAPLLSANDSVYVILGNPITLEWTPATGAQHVQILPLVGDDPIYERDVPGSPAVVEIPWLGTFRWRVSSRDAAGLESLPSVEGLFTVVEK